jgi:DNA-binding CsgD family transcriptional regulator
VAAATLSLLAAAAEESPVLAVADDAHWLDRPSREALVFAGRRLGSEGVLLLLGTRDREWASAAGLPARELRGLPATDAAALIERTGTPVDAVTRKLIVTETGGNPLAILEAITTLTVAYFERGGAEPWAREARAELVATGGAPPRDAGGGLRSLTPHELQVALAVARGATNREAAAALFLSPKTVEFHLGNIYRKLGVRSRTELVRRVEGLT